MSLSSNAFADVDAAEAYATERREAGHRDAHVVLDRYSNDFEVRDGHVDLNVAVPPKGDGRWLFALRIGGYYIRAWDTYRTGTYGRSVCGIIATKVGKVVVLTDQWSPAPHHSIDGEEAKHDACSWVASLCEGEEYGELQTATAWRWEDPETGLFDPGAARAARRAEKVGARCEVRS